MSKNMQKTADIPLAPKSPEGKHIYFWGGDWELDHYMRCQERPLSYQVVVLPTYLTNISVHDLPNFVQGPGVHRDPERDS